MLTPERTHMDTQLAVIVPAELQQAVDKAGLAPAAAGDLLRAFAPHYAAFLRVEDAATACPRDAPKVARELRLKLKSIRVSSEKTRKEQKEAALRHGQAVDLINRLLLDRLKPVEDALDEIERSEEIARQERIAALMAARQEQITPYIAFVSPANVASLGAMTEGQFGALMDRARAAKDAEDARIAAEEIARLAQEQADREERERLRAENVRLEAIAREERRIRREQEEIRAAAEAMLRAKVEAEEAKLAAQRAEEISAALAERAAAAAPDREKLLAFAATVRDLPVPELESEAGCAVAGEIDAMIEKFARWVESKASAFAQE